MAATDTEEQQTIDGTTDEAWENGSDETVEERAASAEGEPEKPPVPTIKGSKDRQLTLLAGGEEPDSSSFKMRGGSLGVEGEYEKGDVIKVMVTLSVDEVHFVDKKDKDGYVIGTERRHICKPLSIQRQQ